MAGGDNASFLILNADGSRLAICGLPLIRPTAICMLASGSNDSLKKASEISASVRDFLLSLSSKAHLCEASCTHGAGAMAACAVCSAAGNAKLLVLVGGEDEEKFDNIPNLEWWLTEEPYKRILPVFKVGADAPSRLKNADLLRYNAAFWTDSITEITTSVLSAANLTSDSHRIFLSYRRLETQPLADDLFVRLSELGFDVFLDRFSVPSAVNFQRRLHHELAEKAMVLVLESDRFGESEWTMEEINYCKRNGLGLFALTMPHGLDPDPAKMKRLAGLDDARRPLTKNDFKGTPQTVTTATGGQFMQWGPLDDSQAKSIIDEIRTRHDKALLGRRDHLRSQMFTAVQEAGATEYGLRADGLISVTGRDDRQYAVWIATRAPELPDFYVTHTGSQFPAGLVGVVVGHRDLLEPEARQRLAWLSGVCKLVFVDEGQMVVAAGRMAMGTL